MTSTFKTRQITEGAIMAVITAVFALIGTFIPLLNTFTFIVITTPVIFVIVRNNMSTGILASIVAAFLVTIFAGPIIAIFFYLQFMLMALAYGYLIKNKKSVALILTTGTVVSVIGTVIVFILIALTGQLNFAQQQEVFYETIDRTIEQYERTGLLSDLEEQGFTQEEIREMLDGVIAFIINIIPVLVVIASALTAILNFIFASFFLRKFQHTVPAFPKFSEWKLPWYSIWGFLGAWVLVLLGDVLEYNIIMILGQNVLIAYGAAFFITGISTVAYIFKNAELSPMLRIAFVIIVVFMFQSIVVITAMIGLLDLLFDVRTRMKKRKEEKL